MQELKGFSKLRSGHERAAKSRVKLEVEREERQRVRGNWAKESKGGKGLGFEGMKDNGKIGRMARAGRGIPG